MADIATLDTAPDTIEAELSYLADTGEKLVTQVAEPGGRDQRQGGGNETHRVKVHNGRPLAGKFEFEREGFRFVPSKSAVRKLAPTARNILFITRLHRKTVPPGVIL